MAGMHVKFDVSPEEFLAALTDAVYQVGLKHGFKDSFMNYKLDIYDALTEVITNTMQVSPACGSCTLGICTQVPRFEPWSKGAQALFLEE